MSESGTSLASALFVAVDALIEGRVLLPPPGERRRLRVAHGLAPDDVARALLVPKDAVESWEAGLAEPEPPQREAYAHLLERLADIHPAPSRCAPGESAAAGRRTAAEEGPRPPAPRGDTERSELSAAARGERRGELVMCPRHAFGTADGCGPARADEPPARRSPVSEHARGPLPGHERRHQHGEVDRGGGLPTGAVGDRAVVAEPPSSTGRPLRFELTAQGWQPVTAAPPGERAADRPAFEGGTACPAPCCPVRR